MRFYLIRHPETENNRTNKMTGWSDSEYSSLGREQFNKIVNFFKKRKYKIIYSSDLSRALKLSKEISKNSGVKLKKTELLRERSSNKGNLREEEKFIRRIIKFIKKNEFNNSIIVSHAGVSEIIIQCILGKKFVKRIDTPRDNIFKIETNKKGNKLKILKV